MRLLGCWAPELHKGPDESRAIARKAQEKVHELLKDSDMRLFVPHTDAEDILDAMSSLGRVMGWIYIGTTDNLSRRLVSAGLASSTKGGALGK